MITKFFQDNNFAKYFREPAFKYIVNTNSFKNSGIQDSIMTVCLRTLPKIPKFQLISWCEKITET